MLALCCGAGSGRMDESLLEPAPSKEDGPPPLTRQEWALGACVAFYYLIDGFVLTQCISYLPDYFEANGLSQTFVGLSTFVQYFGMCWGALASNWAANTFGSVVRRTGARQQRRHAPHSDRRARHTHPHSDRRARHTHRTLNGAPATRTAP